ncbi:MAG TPA: hypothetical protein VFI60_05590 [Candidatus Acidoferrum sp.]|nr:hypothetical protein [Candidatus Acidoferrum sp.]
MRWAIQIEAEYQTLEDAINGAAFLAEQVDCLAVRFHYRPRYKEGQFGKMDEVPNWRVLSYQKSDRSVTVNGFPEVGEGWREVMVSDKYYAQ